MTMNNPLLLNNKHRLLISTRQSHKLKAHIMQIE